MQKVLNRVGARHSMPFGAEVLSDGGVRFRLWAPGAKRVELVLENKSSPMKSAEGWFEHTDPQAGPGALYRYRIDGELLVPDPASRFQPRDVDGPSEVIDAHAFQWTDHAWAGRPWNEAVIYELHVGTFTAEGTYAGVTKKIDYLKDLGVTAIELMPLSDFAGRRNWGYDGVLPFAPDSAYGRPEDLKAIIDESPKHVLDEICDTVKALFPSPKHLVLENDANQARFIGPGRYTAQWNDDSHHAYHVLATGESDGYYVAYADDPARRLARCLAEGFAYQGEISPFNNEPRGEKSGHLPPRCFVG